MSASKATLKVKRRVLDDSKVQYLYGGGYVGTSAVGTAGWNSSFPRGKHHVIPLPPGGYIAAPPMFLTPAQLGYQSPQQMGFHVPSAAGAGVMGGGGGYGGGGRGRASELDMRREAARELGLNYSPRYGFYDGNGHSYSDSEVLRALPEGTRRQLRMGTLRPAGGPAAAGGGGGARPRRQAPREWAREQPEGRRGYTDWLKYRRDQSAAAADRAYRSRPEFFDATTPPTPMSARNFEASMYLKPTTRSKRPWFKPETNYSGIDFVDRAIGMPQGGRPTPLMPDSWRPETERTVPPWSGPHAAAERRWESPHTSPSYRLPDPNLTGRPNLTGLPSTTNVSAARTPGDRVAESGDAAMPNPYSRPGMSMTPLKTGDTPFDSFLPFPVRMSPPGPYDYGADTRKDDADAAERRRRMLMLSGGMPQMQGLQGGVPPTYTQPPRTPTPFDDPPPRRPVSTGPFPRPLSTEHRRDPGFSVDGSGNVTGSPGHIDPSDYGLYGLPAPPNPITTYGGPGVGWGQHTPQPPMPRYTPTGQEYPTPETFRPSPDPWLTSPHFETPEYIYRPTPPTPLHQLYKPFLRTEKPFWVMSPETADNLRYHYGGNERLGRPWWNRPTRELFGQW